MTISYVNESRPPLPAAGAGNFAGPFEARRETGFPPRGRPSPASNEPRINRRIRVPEVRVIADDGSQLGVMQTMDALRKAESLGMDLVEISPMARPPVCKIMDYGKFKYQQKRKTQEAKKKQQQTELKEVKFRPRTDIHDFEVKVNNLRRFLADGDKGRVVVMFRGREIVHPELGREMLKRIAEALKEEAVVEMHPKMEGKQIAMILAPARAVVKKKEP